jgi:hypothetical protein
MYFFIWLHILRNVHQVLFLCELNNHFVGLAYQGKDIVFRLIIEYSSLRDFGP